MSGFIPSDRLRIFDILSIEKGRMSKEYTINRARHPATVSSRCLKEKCKCEKDGETIMKRPIGQKSTSHEFTIWFDARKHHRTRHPTQRAQARGSGTEAKVGRDRD